MPNLTFMQVRPAGNNMKICGNSLWLTFLLYGSCLLMNVSRMLLICIYKKIKSYGEYGHRSRYLSHAKRALYHLS